jgi:hypothetical protein
MENLILMSRWNDESKDERIRVRPISRDHEMAGLIDINTQVAASLASMAWFLTFVKSSPKLWRHG